VLNDTYLKSISSTLIELISTTNMLKSTITGEPFLEGGRISVSKRVRHKMLNFISSHNSVILFNLKEGDIYEKVLKIFSIA